MNPGKASRTAEHNALFRALESARPAGVRLFDDPLAARLLRWPLAALRPLLRMPGGAAGACAVIDRRWPGVRTSVAARTRLIDDTLAGLPVGQLSQLVVLGAGFDTRPYRMECLRSARVFEVDHPDTQAAKRALLRRALRRLPDNVTFVGSDFNLDTLGKVMAEAGFRPQDPTTLLWEGVSNYLTEDAVDATLRWCAQAARGSVLIFTYVHGDVLEHPESFVGSRRLHATLEKVGEGFTFGMDPDAMGTFLGERGLQRRWDIGAADYRARYYGGRARTMVGHEFYRVALAEVLGDD